MKKQRLFLALALSAVLAFGSVITASATLTQTESPEGAPRTHTVGQTGNVIVFTEPDSTDEPGHPVDPEDPDYPVDPGDEGPDTTYNLGALRIEVVPRFNFDEHEATTTERIFDALLPNVTFEDDTVGPIAHAVQVGDWRGTGAGWTLSAELTRQFTGDHPTIVDREVVLTGAQIQLSNIASAIASQGLTGPDAPVAASTLRTGITLLGYEAGPRILAHAQVGQGVGTNTIRFGDVDTNADESVRLHVPASTPIFVTEYTGTVLWTLTAAPFDAGQINVPVDTLPVTP